MTPNTKNWFEQFNLDKDYSKEEANTMLEPLVLQMSLLQQLARAKCIPILIIVEGLEASGKGTTIRDIIMPLDPRGFKVYTIDRLSEEEEMRPMLWKYWKRLPPNGGITLLDRSYYHEIINKKIKNKIDDPDVLTFIDEINSFEEMLIRNGMVIVKIWLHISKKAQKKRFEKLESSKSTSWRITKSDWTQHEFFDEFIDAAADLIDATHSNASPWFVIEANNKRYRKVRLFQEIVKFLQQKISDPLNNQEFKPHPPLLTQKSFSLESIDLSHSLTEEEYNIKLDDLQSELRKLAHKIYLKRIPVVIAFEGWDAAGKGGAIKRLVKELDPRGYEVVPYGAPTAVERQYHYLWRFWTQIPKGGHITVFDRTWYGRVLVERIEKFCKDQEWQRAFEEINQMERSITHFGGVVIKFWLHINKEEQLKRFNFRQTTPEKQWKITDEDWRNREKIDQYKIAVEEMISKTDSPNSPWIVVEANNKYYARIKVIASVIKEIKKYL